MQRLPSSMGAWKKKCIWSVYKVCQHRKRWLPHLKQVHLQPCSSSNTKILKKLGFVGGNVNLCLHIMKSEKGIVYVALYVDNNLMKGDVEAINKAITALAENGLALKVMKELQDYFSWKLKFSKDKTGNVLESLISSWTWWRNLVTMCNISELPVMPKFLIVRPMIESEKISMED